MSIALSSNQQQLQTWLASTAGQYLQAKEQTLYDQTVVDLFGFNALQMGYAQMELLRNSRIPNRYVASEFAAETAQNQLSCSDDFLPFAEMSIDLLLLPHRLEFSERPHQTLREAARVMMPDGHLIISGFNHLSVWGAAAGFKRILSSKNDYPWNGKFIGLTRLKDWLTLLGFEVVFVEMCCHIPPFDQLSWHKRFSFFDKVSSKRCAMLGGVYFIVAKKRVVGITPIKPHWKLNPLKATLIPSPTQSKPTQRKLFKQSRRKKQKIYGQ